MVNFIKKYKWIIFWCVAVFAATAFIEVQMGSKFFGTYGRFAFWEGDIFSNRQSQIFADPYSFSHIIHGLLSYAFLWLVARKLPLRYRLVTSLAMAAVWEILENSPLIVTRYRNVTASVSYAGDSILNSLSDLLMVALGFFMAWRARVWVSVTAVITIEIAMLVLVRDNLTLNAIMLIHPIEAIKAWQLAGKMN